MQNKIKIDVGVIKEGVQGKERKFFPITETTKEERTIK